MHSHPCLGATATFYQQWPGIQLVDAHVGFMQPGKGCYLQVATKHALLSHIAQILAEFSIQEGNKLVGVVFDVLAYLQPMCLVVAWHAVDLVG